MTDIDDPAVRRLLEGRLHDPHTVLGAHPLSDGRTVVRAMAPTAAGMEITGTGEILRRIDPGGLFEWVGPASHLPPAYRLRTTFADGSVDEGHDPYSFAPLLDNGVLGRLGTGHDATAHQYMGAHEADVAGITGIRFTVWAPNAERVSVVGDFNGWDGRRHPMRVRGHTGIWELFMPGLPAGMLYKYEIRNRDTGQVFVKADPYARAFERRPATATVVAPRSRHQWNDHAWLGARGNHDWLRAPMSIYEVHLGSWRNDGMASPTTYRDIAAALVGYVHDMGFTHIELMPLTEHPLDESWGYQPTGYFAPTSRYGDADGLRYLVDLCHASNIGVILDWVPGHFPRDSHALARFDGSALYEYADPQKGSHPDWGTLVFNYARNEVRSFLLSSARYWLEEFHVDGLRVDAVASMLYLDYSRLAGQWAPNIHGGNENLEAIAFLRDLNTMTHGDFPGTVTIAEESTAWPGVSRPVEAGGLGFSMKWNMGWMHDTLSYMALDPIYRRHHHDRLTFSAMYAFSENFVLPFSHDEVVHLKSSMLGKMPGDEWQRFANLRLAYALQWTWPGKKLLFMGCELAQPWEWNAHESLPWHLSNDPRHGGIQRLVRDLNHLYRDTPALHDGDFFAEGFAWLDWSDAQHSLLSYVRRCGEDIAVVLLNFTPVPRHGYRLGVPRAGTYREVFNSDSRFYGGGDLGNPQPLHAEAVPWMNQPWSVVLSAPALGGVILLAS